MKGVRKLAFAAAIMSIAGSVNAAVSVPEGWYAELNAGSSKVSNVTYAAGNSISSSSAGVNLNVGYKFMPYFAAEIGATKYGNATAKVSGVKVAQDKHYSYDLAGKALLPIADSGFELFAKLGIVQLRSHVTEQNSSFVAANGIVVNTGSHTVTGWLAGLGADYTVWQGLAVNGQWQYAKGNSKTGNYSLYSLGLTYTWA